MAKKKAIVKDWIDRDDDFVHRGNFRSGWDDDFESTSDYVLGGFLKPDTSEAEVREIQKLCANRANILADDKKIIFTLNPAESTARTDGKKVTVGTGVLDETGKSFSEKADIMMGLTTHEMAHVLHSTFSHLKNVENSFHKSILNVIEDERIEHLICNDFPGYAANLAKVKKYFLDEKYLVDEALKTSSFTESEEQRHAMQLFDLFFKLVRYPKNIDMDMLSNYEMEIDEIKSILTPYPVTAKQAFDASKEVYKVIHKSIEKKAMDELMPSKADDKSEKVESKGEPSDMPEESDVSSMESVMPPSDSPVDGPKDWEIKQKVKDKIDSIEKLISDMMKDFESDNDSSKLVEVSKSVESVKFNEEFIHDKDNQATFRTGKGNEERYKEYLEVVKGDARRLADSLFIRVFSQGSVMRGLRSGNFDDSKIAEAAIGIPNVHYQTSQAQKKKINLVLLIDESGSMGLNNRFANAAQAAILIEKAFETFNMGDLFIYGFTGDATWGYGDSTDYNQIIRYREPGMNVKYSLGGVRPRAQNRDGQCIRAVANRVRQFTNEPMIFFIISDGAPHSTDYSTDKAIQDTKNAVIEVSKKRFFPIQIGISTGISPETQAEMFTDYINYENPKKMVEDLRKLIIQRSQKIFGV